MVEHQQHCCGRLVHQSWPLALGLAGAHLAALDRRGQGENLREFAPQENPRHHREWLFSVGVLRPAGQPAPVGREGAVCPALSHHPCTSTTLPMLRQSARACGTEHVVALGVSHGACTLEGITRVLMAGTLTPARRSMGPARWRLITLPFVSRPSGLCCAPSQSCGPRTWTLYSSPTGRRLAVYRSAERVHEASVPPPPWGPGWQPVLRGSRQAPSSREADTRHCPLRPQLPGRGPRGASWKWRIGGWMQPASLPPPGNHRWGGLPSVQKQTNQS